MKDKICFSKTWVYLVLLVAAVAGFFYVTNYSNQQKLALNSQAATSSSIDSQDCKRKTGDLTATCQIRTTKNGNPSFNCNYLFRTKIASGVAIDGSGKNLYTYDCTSNQYITGKCCIAENYTIPLITLSISRAFTPTQTPIPTKTPTKTPTSTPMPTPTLTLSQILQSSANAFCENLRVKMWGANYKYASDYIYDQNGVLQRDSNGNKLVSCYKLLTSASYLLKNGSTCISESCFRCASTVASGSEANKCNSATPSCFTNTNMTDIQNIVNKFKTAQSTPKLSDYPNKNLLSTYYKYGNIVQTTYDKLDGNGCYLVKGEVRKQVTFSSQTTISSAPAVGICANKKVSAAYCLCATANSGFSVACDEVKRWVGENNFTQR